MSIPMFHRREHLLQLGISSTALALPISSLLALSARPYAEVAAIRSLFARLSNGRKFGPGRNNAWCVIEVDMRDKLYVQGLVPPTRECIWLEAVSATFVKNWKQIMTPKRLAVLTALGFQEPGPRSPNYWQEIPRADTRSTDIAARIAALTLYEVYGAKKLADATVKLFLPGEALVKSTLGSVFGRDGRSSRIVRATPTHLVN